MATYLILNSVFLVIVVILLRVSIRMPSRAWWVMLGSLLLLTAVFDSVIIGLNIVGYDEAKIVGVYVGLAPIEDFFYAVLAAIIIPSFWYKFARKDVKENHA